jgi:hypothetical protein
MPGDVQRREVIETTVDKVTASWYGADSIRMPGL